MNCPVPAVPIDGTPVPGPDSAAVASAAATPAVLRGPHEHRALGVLALLAVLAVVYVALPLGIGLFLGTLTAFALQPLYLRLCRALQRPTLAAVLCVLLVLLLAAGTFVAFGYLLVQHGVELSRELVSSLQPGGSLRSLMERGNHVLGRVHVQPNSVLDRLREGASALTSRVGSLAAVVAGVTAHSLLMLFFLVLTAFYMLRRWSSLTRRLVLLLPLSPRHTTALLDEFRRIGSSVLLGTVLTGAAQGLLAGVGFAVTRVPQAAFFGALTAVASLVPAVGTLLVWVPAGIYLLATGHTALGVVELVYGAVVVVGISDYVIRPALVGGHGEAPALLTFIALFGGVEVFGLIGLVLGPVIMSLSVALLRIYEQERRQQVTLPPSSP